MLSVTTISQGQAGSYYQKDSYYTADEGKGEWAGKGAEILGLHGEVKAQDFENLIKGFSPDKIQLVSSSNCKEYKAGIDLTFSAPKSVSILAEYDPRVLEVHRKAVSSALEVAERYAAGRLWNTEAGKVERFYTNNIVVAKFEHRTSRELDPQLHTHSFIANVTQLPNGEFRALDRKDFYEQKLYLGQVYRSSMAVGLQKIDYAVRHDNNGLFEITGIDRKLISEFSSRSAQIEAKKVELRKQFSHASESKLNEIACLDSRISKKDVDLSTIRENWQKRISKLGYSKEQILESTKKEFGKSQTAENRLSADEYLKLAANAIHDNESTFSREEVIKNALRLSVGRYTNADIEASFNSLLNKEILQVGKQYATAEMVRIEHEILSDVIKSRNSKNSISSTAEVKKDLSRYLHLTTGQRQAVELIATTKDQVIGIQGDAGTGKTTVLKTAKEVIEKEGYRLRGLAFTGKAANEIEQASGIKSTTLHSFLGMLENEEKAIAEISKNEIWVVDEASLVGSRQLKSLVDASGKYNSRLILIGDTKQLAAVNAGKMFKELQEHGMGTVRMTETLRQVDETYKSIVTAISEKRLEDAFDLIRENGKIEVAEKGDLTNKVCKDYLKSDIEKTIIVTDTNRNRRELNSQIREQLKAEGKLTGGADFNTLEPKNITGTNRNFANSYEKGNRLVFTKAGAGSRVGATAKVVSVDTHNHTLNYEIKKKDGSSEVRELDLKEHGDKVSVFKEYETEFAKGDKVLFAKNDKMLGVQNGLTGTVKKINGDQLFVKMQNGDSKEFSIDQYRYLSHGYAITDYKSQGQTADKVLVHATTSDFEKTFNGFYVSSTRGRNDFKIYTDSDSKLIEQVKLEQEKTSTITKKSAEQTMNNFLDKSEISKPNEISEGKGISKTAEIEIII